MSKIILFNKPFGVLSQFTDSSLPANNRKTLSEFIDTPNVYAAGRLDKDSEGLLILTDDGRLQHKISDPKNKMSKFYYVQIEGQPSDDDLQKLRLGVLLKDGRTAPANVRMVSEPAWLWPRNPPIRYRKSVQDCWLEIVITEGKNRQIRRMTAAIGYPTLRLVRYRIGSWTIDGLENGKWRAAS
ncbi:MAG: pseudouridine synthase [Paracoccaceae bacterium]